MEKLKELIKHFCTREVILYVVFGVFTTIVNLGSFYAMSSLLHINENLANFVAILLAVLFAYFTNRKLVFHTTSKGFKENFHEFLKFIAGRAVTMVVEWVGCFLLFKTSLPNIISKCLVSVVVVILNYIISKFFTFKKK